MYLSGLEKKRYLNIIGVALIGLLWVLIFLKEPVYAIFVVLGILSLTFSLYLYYRNFEGFLVLVLLLCFNFANLVPTIGKFHTYDLLFLLLLFSLFDTVFSKRRSKYANHLNSTDNFMFFSKMFIAFLILVFVGIVTAYVHEGQSLFIGPRGARRYFFILFYFVVKHNKVNLSKLTKYIINLSIFLCILNLIQFLSYGKLHIFYIATEQVRIGLTRFFGGYSIALLGVFFSLARYVRHGKNRDLMILFILGLIPFVLVQNRMSTLGIAFATLIILTRNKNIYAKKVLIFLLVVGFAFSASYRYLNHQYNDFFIFRLMEKTYNELKYSEGSYLIRADAYNYYLGLWEKSPIIGWGVYSSTFTRGSFEQGRKRGYYLSDIGWGSILYNFGILGVLWAISYLVTAIKRAIKYGFYEMEIYVYYVICTLMTLNYFILNQHIIILALITGMFFHYRTKDIKLIDAQQ